MPPRFPSLLFMLVVPFRCFAMNLEIKGEIKHPEEYNSNLFLTTSPHTDVLGQGVDIALASELKSGGIESLVNANFNNRIYIGEPQLDYFNQLFEMKNSYAFSRSRIGFNAQYNIDTSSAAMDDPADAIGFVFQRIPKVSRMIQPNYTYTISDQTTLNAAYKYRDTQYDKVINLARSPFPDAVGHTTTADISHQLTKTLQLTGSYFYKDFLLIHRAETVQPDSMSALQNTPRWQKEIYTQLAMLGANYAFSDSLKVTVSAGLQNNAESSQAYDVSSAGTIAKQISSEKGNTFSEVYLAKLNKRITHPNDARSDIALEHSRSIIPNPKGLLVGYDKYSASLAHAFSPALSAKMSLSYTDRSFPLAHKKNSSVMGAQVGIGWKLVPSFELAGNYQYLELNDKELQANGELDIATAHALILTISYAFGGQVSF